MTKLYYNKILEVSEDSERVYFTFYNNSDRRIIGIPKKDCANQAVYAGYNFDSLTIADYDRAKQFLSQSMKHTMLAHPAVLFCNKDVLMLL